MKIRDVLTEAAPEGSNDYQQMMAMVRGNPMPGVPPEQRVALALFKELQKQKQHNAQLDSELDAAEQRIDQATSSGELQGQELGMHRSELERERERGAQQKADIGRLGKTYAEREAASQQQVADLAANLDAVKSMPGVNKDSVERLEKQIRELGQNGIGAERVADLERSIAAIRSAESADDAAIKDLIVQVKAAQEATAELSKTKTGLGKDLEAQLAHFKEVEQTVNNLRNTIGALKNDYTETDATVLDLENDVAALKLERDAALSAKQELIRQANAKSAQQSAPVSQPTVSPAARATAQKLIQRGVLQPEPVAESAFKRSIAWATGKTK